MAGHVEDETWQALTLDGAQFALPAKARAAPPPENRPQPPQTPHFEPDAAVFTQPRGHFLSGGLLAADWAQERDFGHAFLLLPLFLGLGAAVWYALPNGSHLALSAYLTCAIVMALMPAPAMFRAVALALLALGCGMALAAVEDLRRGTILLDSPVTTEVTGRVVSREVAARGSLRYVLEVAETAGPTVRRPPERITLVVRARHTAFAPGAWLKVRARLSPPSGPALPGLNDFAFDSYMRGIGALGFAYGVPISAPPPPVLRPAAAGWMVCSSRPPGCGRRSAIASAQRFPATPVPSPPHS